jgi:hypothetical protein
MQAGLFASRIRRKEIKMIEKQQSETQGKKSKYSKAYLAARSQIDKKLQESSGRWREFCRSVNQGDSHPRTAMRAAPNGKRLLTPSQTEAIRTMQMQCRAIIKMAQQANTVALNAELDLPRLLLPEIALLLAKIDDRIVEAKTTARRLGVAAVQPEVKLNFLQKLQREIGNVRNARQSNRAASQSPRQ